MYQQHHTSHQQPVQHIQQQTPFRQGPETSQYPPPPTGQSAQPYPNQLSPNRPEMATIHPQFQQPYGDGMPRLPAPQYYQQQPPQPNLQPNFQQPPQQQQQQGQPNSQAAPRQRTAIACKYCRRRKIRCSGFENAPDGRCANCIRFNQECVFTPVSSQTQAFVPAQAVYGRRSGPQQGPPPQLYGPYGQPIPRGPEGYPQQYPMPSPGHPGPPMQHPYPPQGYPPGPYGPQGYGPPHYEQPPVSGGPPPPQAAVGSRRRRDEDDPHTPTLPPPNPGHQSQLAGHEQPPYGYPDGYNGSPAPSQSSYHNAPQGYYPPQPQRASPSSAYSYDTGRGSNSPHTSQAMYGQPGLQPHPGQPTMNAQGRTPPPHADGRNGLAIRDIVSGEASQGERTAADSDMVSALNRTSRR